MLGWGMSTKYGEWRLSLEVINWSCNLLPLGGVWHAVMHRFVSVKMSPGYMFFVWILVLVPWTTTQGQAVTMRKYVSTSHENDVWPGFIYQTVAFNRKPFVSKSSKRFVSPRFFLTRKLNFQVTECGIACQRDKINCAGFVESADSCYLGNPSVPQTHLPSPQADRVDFYFAQG